MANKELVYLSDVRRALLRYEPEAAYTLEGLRRVDAVEVVRCKDCKWSEDYRGVILCNSPEGIWGGVTDNDYCSRGERRTNEVD